MRSGAVTEERSGPSSGHLRRALLWPCAHFCSRFRGHGSEEGTAPPGAHRVALETPPRVMMKRRFHRSGCP